MSLRKTYLIGRSESCDARLDGETVSRRHAEITVLGDGRLYLTDRGGPSGTEIFRDGAWHPLRQDYVSVTERVRFGGCETSIASLLQLLGVTDPQPSHAPHGEAPGLIDRPRRNPLTGEIEDAGQEKA
jgi:hypothetical protein